MKKTVLLFNGFLFLACSIYQKEAVGQSWIPLSGNLVTTSTNNVGINTASPVEKLTINDGNIALTRSAFPNDIGNSNFRYISAKTQRSLLFVGTDPNTVTGESNGPCIMMAASNNGWIPGRTTYYSRSKIGGSAGNITSQEFLNWNASQNIFVNLLSLKDNNGHPLATIGEINPSEWNAKGLLVKGDVSTNPEDHVSATIGAVHDGDGMWGTGYIGFNLHRNNSTATGYVSSSWPYKSSGSYNGGSVIYGRLDGDLVFSTKATNGGSAGTLSDGSIAQNAKMRVTHDGKVIIANQVVGYPGSTGGESSIDYTSSAYKLFVEKGILTEKVRVAVKNSLEWADYVFSPDYKLTSLEDLGAFIAKEKHLPGIPTTEEVIKEGVDLGQMQAKLLQKVEELTRYVLMQQQEINSLKKKHSR